MKKPEKECPECQGQISWIVVHNKWGAPAYNGICKKCAILFRHRETPQLKRGREMANDFKDCHPLDKRISCLPCDVQIGIYRELQKNING